MSASGQQQASCWIAAWGKAPQPHADEDGQDIHVTIRKMIED